VYPSGEVGVVERRGGSWIAAMKENSGNKFKVHWGERTITAADGGEEVVAAQQWPLHRTNCTQGCHQLSELGGSCLCDVTVENLPLVAGPAARLPTELELRAALHLGGSTPEHFAAAAAPAAARYTLCIADGCMSQPGIKVWTRGTGTATPIAFDVHTIFEFVGSGVGGNRPSSRRPTRYLLNRVSTVRVGHATEYAMLDAAAVAASTCEASSDDAGARPCENALDFSLWTEWSTTEREGVGGWIKINFDAGETLVDRMVYSNKCGNEKNARVRLEFSDGTSQPVTLDDSCFLFEVAFAPVVTAFVKIVVESVYSTWKNGAKEIRFLAPGNVNTRSSVPCEHAGLLPVGQAECEQAARHVAPVGLELARYGQQKPGSHTYVPPGCSLDQNSGEVHWNTYPTPVNWASRYGPVCKLTAAAVATRSDFRFRNAPHFMPNTGESAYMPGGSTTAPFGDGDHLIAPAEHETEALVDHLFEHENTAPFVAYRMIQRLVTSNPSPR
jgi:hypothetical protein